MKAISLVLSAYLALTSLDPARPPVADEEWNNYLSQHGKVYDAEESTLRRLIYSQSKQKVEQFNENAPEAEHYQLGLNHMSDWTKEERKRLNGFRLPEGLQSALANGLEVPMNSAEDQQFLNKLLNNTSKPVPEQLDWRKFPNRVGEVRNQGTCGSCWAFASVGVLEGQMIEENKSKLVELSPQNLVDCVTTAFGCSGGIMKSAFQFVPKMHGIDDERSYPYEARQGTCRSKTNKPVFNDRGAAVLPAGDEEALKKVVANYGPVSVAIDASSEEFRYYESGVFSYAACSKDFSGLDHAVLVVGYGTDPELGDYWIVKNSWSNEWGEDGYFRMARNRGDMCGIALMPTIATF